MAKQTAIEQDGTIIESLTILFSYILLFIAGANTTGLLHAITTVESISSAMPFATLPMMFAVAGAVIIASAFSAKLICLTSAVLIGSNISTTTGFCESV